MLKPKRKEPEMRWYDIAALVLPLIGGTLFLGWLISLAG